jgi:ArsR family transcriptional regulator
LYDAVSEVYRALGDPTRLHILALLKVREACVCELVELLPVSQPAVSQHLRKLRQAGLLIERRHKYWTYYALRPDIPPAVSAIIQALPDDPAGAAWLATHQVDTACGMAMPESVLTGSVNEGRVDIHGG